MSVLPSRFTAAAVLVGAVALMPLPALAAAAAASQNVNVRSGPGATFPVMGQLQRGEAVDISKCQGLFCYVTFAGNRGWVSASYLTRDSVPQAPSTVIQAQTATPRPALPQPTAPRVASAEPSPPPAAMGEFPPAYHSNAAAPDYGPAPTYGAAPDVNAPPADIGQDASSADDPGYPGDSQDPSYGPGDSGSQVTLPPENGDVIAGTDVERPKADIPGPPSQADGYGDPGPYADAPDVGQLPADDWNTGPDARWRSYDRPRDRFADGGAAKVCFLGDGPDGGRFCLGAGQSREQFGNWRYRISSIRNPLGLRVTICSTGIAGGGCRIYQDSGPVLLPGDATIASISVAPPPGY